MNYAYERNEQIIKSKTREFLGIGSVVTASAYLDYVIDFILIGGILGADAVAAAGLCDSMVDIAEFPGFVLSSGGSIAAGILLGKRKRQQANVVFTVSFLLALLGGLLCCCLLPFCDLFSGILTNNGTIAGDVSRYTFLTLLSAPLPGVNLALSSFAILDNHSKLAMAQVITSNVANLALDFLFMGCMDMGVSGAAAATLVGTILSILVGSRYPFSPKRSFRFVLPQGDVLGTFRTLSASSSSFAFDKASRIAAGLAVNMVLMYFVGNIGVTLYAIFSRLKFILRILVGGALKTISTLGSMLYGERDFFGIRKMMAIIFKYTYTVTAVVVIALFLAPGTFLQFYGIDVSNSGSHIVFAFRLMLLSLPIFWMNDLVNMYYISIQRQSLSVLLLALQNVVFRVLLLWPCVALASHWATGGLSGVALWCCLVESLSLAATLAWEKVRYGHIAIWKKGDERTLGCHIFSISGKPESVADIHEEIARFCVENGIPKNKGNLLAIAFEEAALNIINHSKSVDTIDICLLLEDGNLIVRIRDNGTKFDPLEYEDESDILHLNNIKLLEKITDKKDYTRIMNMNNTVLSIRL